MKAVGPLGRLALPLLFRLTSPDLPAEPGVVVNDADTSSALGCADRGRHARRSAADYENVEALCDCHRIPAQTSLVIRPDFHLGCALGLATPAVRYAVDRHAALKADTHSA
jgi:hypothetical protein